MCKFLANVKKIHIILFFLSASVLFAEESTDTFKRKIVPRIIDRRDVLFDEGASQSLADVALPFGFTNIYLGITFEEATKAISANRYFQAFEEPDIYTVPQGVDRVILVYGSLDTRTDYQFIREGYFQFNENDELISINLYLNTDVLDYFTLYQLHEQKYGTPEMLNPQKAEWINADVTISLEKPLTVKYLKNLEAQEVEETLDLASEREKLYEDFLSSF